MKTLWLSVRRHGLITIVALVGLGQAPSANADACLRGTWDVVPSTFVGDLRAIAGARNISWSVLGGQYRLQFTGDGQFTDVKNRFRIQADYDVGVPMKMVQKQNTRMTGRYAVETAGTLKFWLESSAGTASSQVFVAGNPIGGPQEHSMAQSITGEPVTVPYECAGDRLKTLATFRPGGVGADWVEFSRVRR